MTRTQAARLVALFAFCITTAWPPPAPGHDWRDTGGRRVDANWIMNNSKTAHCCGPEDCYPVPGRVYLTPQGWRVRGLAGTVPIEKTFPSIERRPWACQQGSAPILRCLFLPPTGS